MSWIVVVRLGRWGFIHSGPRRYGRQQVGRPPPPQRRGNVNIGNIHGGTHDVDLVEGDGVGVLPVAVLLVVLDADDPVLVRLERALALIFVFCGCVEWWLCDGHGLYFLETDRPQMGRVDNAQPTHSPLLVPAPS